MRKIVRVLGMVVAVALPYSALAGEPSATAKCITVQGTFEIWNGWPPSARIESLDHKRVFGLESAFDGDNVPKDRSPENLKDEIARVVKADKANFDGTFVFCLNSKTTSVPYDKRRIELGWVKSFKPSN